MKVVKKHSMRALVGVMGFALVGSALAAVTSLPTTTVMGRAPQMAPPVATWNDVNTNGVVDTGDILTAVDGTITDLDTDTPIPSTYRWHDGTTDVGTANTYSIQAADLGKGITLNVIPHTDALITDPADGLEISAVLPVPVAPGSTLLSVDIGGYVGGNPQVGTALTATPTCVTTCGTVTYQWEIEATPGQADYGPISGATSASYTPVKGDQKRAIQVVAN